MTGAIYAVKIAASSNCSRDGDGSPPGRVLWPLVSVVMLTFPIAPDEKLGAQLAAWLYSSATRSLVLHLAALPVTEWIREEWIGDWSS